MFSDAVNDYIGFSRVEHPKSRPQGIYQRDGRRPKAQLGAVVDSNGNLRGCWRDGPLLLPGEGESQGLADWLKIDSRMKPYVQFSFENEI